MQKWYPKSNEKCVQKGPQKWGKITKMCSQNHPKTGFQKNIENMMIFSTPTPLWIELSCRRELDFHFLIRCVFGTLLGLILEVFWEAKWRPKPSKSHLKKTSKKRCPKWPKNGPKGGPKMEPKSLKMRSWKHLVSKMAPKRPPDPSRIDFGEVLGPIWDHFRQFFWHIFNDFCMHSLAACCKQKRSKSQGNTKRMQQKASKKQLLSSCRLALKSSLANVNELSGPR